MQVRLDKSLLILNFFAADASYSRVDSRPEGLFGKQIDTSLFDARGLDGTATTGSANSTGNGQGSLESIAAGVLLDRNEARIRLVGNITITYTSSNHSRGNHHHVQRCWKFQQIKSDSVTRSDDQSCVGKQVVTDLFLPHLLLIFIRNEEEDNLSLCNGFTDANSSESIGNSLGLVFILNVTNNDVLDTRVSKVKSLCSS
jgi:hypothetical protein